MSVVNFAIPSAMEKRISGVIKEKGFASKAEFFRLAAIYFMDIINKPTISENERFNLLDDALTHELTALARRKKYPSLRDQLKEI